MVDFDICMLRLYYTYDTKCMYGGLTPLEQESDAMERTGNGGVAFVV